MRAKRIDKLKPGELFLYDSSWFKDQKNREVQMFLEFVPSSKDYEEEMIEGMVWFLNDTEIDCFEAGPHITIDDVEWKRL